MTKLGSLSRKAASDCDILASVFFPLDAVDADSTRLRCDNWLSLQIGFARDRPAKKASVLKP